MQRFQDILQNLHFTNTADKSDKKVLYVIFGNIHNIMSLKLTTLLFKISYGKNLYLRYSSVKIFQTRHIMTLTYEHSFMDCSQLFLRHELVSIRWDASENMTSNLLFGSCPTNTVPLIRLKDPPTLQRDSTPQPVSS